MVTALLSLPLSLRDAVSAGFSLATCCAFASVAAAFAGVLLYAAARLLEILMSLKRKPVDVFARLPNGVNTPEIQMPLAEGQPFEIMNKVLENPAMADAEVHTIDGLRAEFADGWGLMRASNTTPMLIFRFEGTSQDALVRIQGQFRELLTNVDSSLSPPF